MKKQTKMTGDGFSTFHPLVNFIYFVSVIGFGMFFLHPACLLISLLGSISYSIYLRGRKAISFQLLYLLPMLMVMALVNPLFNHEGATILTYFRTGNPLTLEAIYYGLASATMIVSSICWFSCFNEIITSDKLIYLFGRIIPAFSLILSMTMRFVPRFNEQIRHIADAQRSIGRDVSNGSVFQRAQNGLLILSAMATWALENSIETSNSMKSRGYGLKGRTSFSIYKMENRDKRALLFLLMTGGIVFFGALQNALYYRYYPTLKVQLGSTTYAVLVMYAALIVFPIAYNLRESMKYKKWIENQSVDMMEQFGNR